MIRKLTVLSVALVAVVVAACASHTTGSSTMPSMTSGTLPGLGSDLTFSAKLPPKTIGEELPSEGLGVIKSEEWKAHLGGFTQKRFSESLAFPPGTKITIHNLSKVNAHTLDVVKEISGPPAVFPSDPTLSKKAMGHGMLETGFASGVIEPGKSVTITLAKPGTYLIGCAFHYSQGMRDVIVVKKGAVPGPQASPSPTPTSGGGGGGGW